MMLYLTGASSSSKSNEAPQDDTMKSLGGYISSSPVPNGALNALFDLVSVKTIKERNKETVAIGLINKFDDAVSDVSLKIVGEQDNVCCFKIAATTVDKNYCMEHISNRYAEPINAEFYDATFFRGSVDVEIITPAVSGEEIAFEPFGIIATVAASGTEGTYEAVSKAFSRSEEYRVKRLTETTFRIERRDDTVVDPVVDCYVLSSENSKFVFSDKFKNVKQNSVFLTERLEPGEAIGIWIQRTVSDEVEKTDEELLKDYSDKRKVETTEEVELVINYNIVENKTED